MVWMVVCMSTVYLASGPMSAWLDLALSWPSKNNRYSYMDLGSFQQLLYKFSFWLRFQLKLDDQKPCLHNIVSVGSLLKAILLCCKLLQRASTYPRALVLATNPFTSFSLRHYVSIPHHSPHNASQWWHITATYSMCFHSKNALRLYVILSKKNGLLSWKSFHISQLYLMFLKIVSRAKSICQTCKIQPKGQMFPTPGLE